MPTYDYRCNTCGIEFEYFQHMSDAPLTRCPKEECPLEDAKKGTGVVERRISAGTGLVFKGSGFYITDYKGSSSSPSKEHSSVKKAEGGVAPASSGTDTPKASPKKSESND